MQQVLLSLCFLAGAFGDPVVDSGLGKISGKILNVLDVEVEAFLGIPYAKPPLGKLRFALPEAFGSVGDLHATEYGPSCPQLNPGPTAGRHEKIAEDCLHLNVLRKRGTSSSDKKAVIANIHGGGYVIGSSSEAPQTALAGLGDVILVSFNYRLGILGFADMGNFAPGNLGLHDQRLALQWIQDNIADFGGDPDRVTVIGVSAGSMSLAAQIITPIDDKDLFQSAVLDAGVVKSNGFFEDCQSSYIRLKKIAEQVHCPLDSPEMVDCLRKISVDELLPVSLNTTGSNGILFFVACADGKFIPKNVEEYVEKNSATLRKIRSIIGYAKDEGTFFVSTNLFDQDFPNPQTKEGIVDHCETLSTTYDHKLDFTSDRTKRLITELYVDEHPNDSFNAIAAFQADGVFKCPINNFVRSFARHNDEVYVYQFERKLRSSYWGILNPDLLGAFHFSPYVHFVGVLLSGEEPVEPLDKLFSQDSINMISNFAKTRDVPTFRGTKWPSFSESGEMMIFDETPSTTPANPFGSQADDFETSKE